MAEYIEKEGVKKSINFLFDIRLNVAPEIKQPVLDLIDGERAADVQPVKRGRWICNEELYYNDMTKCSCCNSEYYVEDLQTLMVYFCPNCGADMRGDTE